MLFDTTNGSCARSDPAEWDNDKLLSERIRNICARCPINEACLDWAMRNNTYGIWAGTSRDERTALKRGVHRARCPMCRSYNPWPEAGAQICTFCGFGWPVRRKTADPAR